MTRVNFDVPLWVLLVLRMDIRKFFVKRVSATLEDDLLSFGQSIFVKLDWN